MNSLWNLFRFELEICNLKWYPFVTDIDTFILRILRAEKNTSHPVGRKLMGMIISVIDNEDIGIIINICKSLKTKVTLTVLMM